MFYNNNLRKPKHITKFNFIFYSLEKAESILMYHIAFQSVDYALQHIYYSTDFRNKSFIGCTKYIIMYNYVII